MSAIRLLRAALKDACMACAECHGHGSKAMPGATIRCPRCAPWRRVLADTKPRERTFIEVILGW